MSSAHVFCTPGTCTAHNAMLKWARMKRGTSTSHDPSNRLPQFPYYRSGLLLSHSANPYPTLRRLTRWGPVFGSLLELAKSIGCPYLSELDMSKGAKYTSHMMIDDFLTVLSDCVETAVLRDVNESPCIGILRDESTDIANLKQLVVFLKYLVKGVPQTRFLKVVSLLNGKAETIEQKLLEIIQTCKISLMKVAGFGSDGAAVMVGKKSGVATRLKAHNGEMISIHCGPHRLALACSQAAESNTYIKRFDGHLISLFYYFKNSPVREAARHQIQEMMEEPVLHLKRAVHTRWLSHDQQ